MPERDDEPDTRQPEGPGSSPTGPGASFPQDPHVERLRPDPSAPPAEVLVLNGLAGNSDREGWARLYFDQSLTYYAEFRREDVVSTERLPPEQAPMLGLQSTRVSIRRDAVVEYTRTTRAQPGDAFDLDVRLAAPVSGAPLAPPPTVGPRCPTNVGRTCDDTYTCQTQCGTCQTCQTQCGTCQTCQTCQTQCGTCQTCQTQCGTCQTCQTCRTCDTCHPCPTVLNTHCFTCRGGCNLTPACV